MSRLDHPNIIRLHRALRTKNTIYLITEYCDQGDLKSFLRKYILTRKTRYGCPQDDKSYLTESEARVVISQVVESMEFLNLNNIVHRDIKIDNILVKSRIRDFNNFSPQDMRKDAYKN